MLVIEKRNLVQLLELLVMHLLIDQALAKLPEKFGDSLNSQAKLKFKVRIKIPHYLMKKRLLGNNRLKRSETLQVK